MAPTTPVTTPQQLAQTPTDGADQAPSVPTLQSAPADTANATVDKMTPEQVVALKSEVTQLPVSEQQQTANELAQRLGASQLTKLAPAFADGMMEQAVETYASAEVKTDYQAAPTKVSQADIDKLAGLQQTAQDAHNETQEYDQEVGDLLGQAGPLTPEQRQKFIDAYKNDPEHPERAEAYKQAAAADQALSDYVQQNQAALLEASKTNPDAAQKIHDAIGLLAGSGHGEQALSLVTAILSDPATKAAFSKFDDLQGTLLQDSVSAATAEALAGNDWNPVLAANQIKLQIQGLKGIGDITQAGKLLDEVASGNFDSLKKLGAEFGSKSPLMRAIGGAGILLGAASAVGYSKEGEYADAVKEFAAAGDEGLKAVASATKHLVDTGKLAKFAGTAETFAKFSERFAPVLGLVASATALVADGQKAKTGNPGYIVAILGDAVSFIGSCVEVFPPAAVIGAVINGVGNAIWAIGTFIGDLISGGEQHDALVDYLNKAGIDPSIADTMANVGVDANKMKQKLDMTPEQVQALLKAHPQIGAYSSNIQTFTDIAAAVLPSPTDGSQVQGLADALSKDATEGAFQQLVVQLKDQTSSGNVLSKWWTINYLRQFPSTQEYLASISPPGTLDQASDRANADYVWSPLASPWTRDSDGYVGKLRATDSTAYRAELVTAANKVGNYSLEGMVSAISESGTDDDKKLMAQALIDAYGLTGPGGTENGSGLTVQQVNDCLAQLGQPPMRTSGPV